MPTASNTIRPASVTLAAPLWAAGMLGAEANNVIQQAFEVARKSQESRVNGLVQLVQQNVNVNIQAPHENAAVTIDERIQLRLVAAQLQSQQNSFELAASQHTAALQQRIQEVLRMEHMNQQEMRHHMHHVEARIETDARRFAQQCESYVNQEKSIAQQSENQVATLHRECNEHSQERLRADKNRSPAQKSHD